MDGMNYPTCVAYGEPETACPEGDLLCPVNSGLGAGVFGYAGNQREYLEAAYSRNDFMHPECPTATCTGWNAYWQDLLASVLTDVDAASAASMAANVCFDESGMVQYVTSDAIYNTCIGFSENVSEPCNLGSYLCAGNDGAGRFTFGWPGQIARAVAVAIQSPNYLHPQCPLSVC